MPNFARRNTNIVDNMIRMMERYTDQLEDLVEERTRQLAEEKTKTDELLYKMLPRWVGVRQNWVDQKNLYRNWLTIHFIQKQQVLV